MVGNERPVRSSGAVCWSGAPGGEPQRGVSVCVTVIGPRLVGELCARSKDLPLILTDIGYSADNAALFEPPRWNFEAKL